MSSARYVYAIVRRDAPLPTPLSIGVDLAVVPCRALAAVTRRMPDDSADITMSAVLHHEGVVEAVREKGPALPVRFGTVFQSERTLTAALSERYEPLLADLDRLGDKAELSLTALWVAGRGVWDVGCGVQDGDCGPRNATRGGSYLRARAAELQRDEAIEAKARSLAQNIDEVLGELALERRVSLTPTPRIAIRTSYLIDPEKTNAFRMAFDAIRREQGELRMLLTGPWPPYSFTAGPNADGFTSTEHCVVKLAEFFTDAIQDRRDQSEAARNRGN